MPAENLYDDSPAPPAAEPEAAPLPQAGDESGDEQETALLPKSLFAGREVKPGDTLTVRVERVHDGQVEVCADEGYEEEPEAEPAPGGPPADAEMQSMIGG